MLRSIVYACLVIAGSLSATNIVAISGSTNSDSYNAKLLYETANIAREMGARVKVINLNHYRLPYYTPQEERLNGMPSKAKELKKLLMESDAVMIASPEKKGSVTDKLLTVINWLSRDEDGRFSNEAFKGRKFAIMSTSSDHGGGANGLFQLRSILSGLGAEVVPKELAVPAEHDAFNEQNHFKHRHTKEAAQVMISQLM